jgi:hypothetical protein
MTRRNRLFFIFGIAILFVLIVLSLLYLSADKSKMNLAYFSIDLSFAGAIGTMGTVALALIAIGYSIKEADIHIFLGEKNSTPHGILQEIRVRNQGNALGNMANALVEIEAPQSSLISFAGATGLNFQPSENQSRKQYSFVNPQMPIDLYPGKKNWQLLGFVEVPPKVADHRVKFIVQIVGTQGFTWKEFTINI